jgi:hypothetical protein
MFLRQDQIDFYRQNGFLIVEGALSAWQVAVSR